MTVGGFQFGSRESIDEALETSKADLVFFLTDFVAAGSKPDVEVAFGTTIIDACAASKRVSVVGCSFFLRSMLPCVHFYMFEMVDIYLDSSSLHVCVAS